MSTSTIKQFSLAEIEKDVESGWRKSGEALMAIRDGELWKQGGYKSWASYCETRWSYSKQYCNRLIAGTDAIKQVETLVSAKIPETQARELSRVEPEKRAKVLIDAATNAAAEDRAMTAKDIREAAVEVDGPEERPHVVSADEEGLRRINLIASFEARWHALMDKYEAEDFPIVRNWLRHYLTKTEIHDQQSQ